MGRQKQAQQTSMPGIPPPHHVSSEIQRPLPRISHAARVYKAVMTYSRSQEPIVQEPCSTPTRQMQARGDSLGDVYLLLLWTPAVIPGAWGKVSDWERSLLESLPLASLLQFHVEHVLLLGDQTDSDTGCAFAYQGIMRDPFCP